MKFKAVALVMMSSVAFFSCVSNKKMKKCEVKNATLDSAYLRSMVDNSKLREDTAAEGTRIRALEQQLADNKSTNSQVMSELKDLSVISGTQAESIKKSLDNIGVKDAYIKDLQAAINRKDSLNMALVINLKSAVGNIDDKDINIKVEKGVVYVDISDKLLFKSGSYDVTDAAKAVLGKVAKVVLAQPDIEFMVEGNTDNAPFKRGILTDNWDLSVMRATSVVRILQNQYHVPSAHMTAAGRAEFQPITGNDTKEGMAANRRTRIIILPQLDQFFKLLEKPKE
jgi:chemotaxis protein MotB